jgi:hypothetical protein
MKTNNDMEQLLMSGKNLSLSSHEKASIKSALLEHISQSLKHEKQPIPSPWTSWVLRGSVAFASLLIMFIGTTYASQDSLPGEPLYVMKIHVFEEMVALTKIQPSEHLAYDLSLMETRLKELQTITNQSEIHSPEDLTAVSTQIVAHVTDITKLLETVNESEIPETDKITALSTLSSITKAQAKVIKNESELSSITEITINTQEITSDILNSAIQDFTADQPIESVNEYLSEQLTTISQQLHASTTNETARDTAGQHLQNVDEALISGNTTAALISILEAQQTIESEEYLESGYTLFTPPETATQPD